MESAFQNADFCFHAIPVQKSAEFLKEAKPYIPHDLPIVLLSKGLEASTGQMMSEIVQHALENPGQPMVSLSGPSFAIEIMERRPTVMVAACKDMTLATRVQHLLASPYLRYPTTPSLQASRAGDVSGPVM